MHRHISRVYVDSRYTLSDGEFEIPGEAVEMSPTSRCWLGEFTCVVAWDTIDETNRNFYVVEAGVPRTIQLSTGPHDIESIRAELESKLNGPGKNPAVGTYTVTRVSTGTGGATFRSLQISVDAGSFALPDGPDSIGAMVPFPDGSTAASVHTSTFVDVRRVHSIYVHSPSFGNYNCVGPRGERTILAKVPVTEGYGSLLHWHGNGSEHDFIECGVRALKVLRLELRDVAGRPLVLKGTHWSATLIFER